jgi:hypothetical protein
MALLTDISFAVAAAGAIVGLVFLLVGQPSGEQRPTASLRVAPFASLGGAGLSIGGEL